MTMIGHRGLAARAIHHGQNADLQQVKAEAAEHLEGWKRARADYQNLQKEADRRISQASEDGKDSVFRELFPILDYFEAALQHVPDAQQGHAWVDGVRQIHQALQSFLNQSGVLSIGELGAILDPVLHEAVAEEHAEQEAGTITAVLARGYMRNGRILRPAKVRVSRGPASVEKAYVGTDL